MSAPAKAETEAPAASAPSATADAPRPDYQPRGRLRQLIGRSPFRNPADQVEHERLFRTLAWELKCESAIEGRHLYSAAARMVRIDRFQAAKEKLLAYTLVDAAREVLAPGWTYYQPGHPGYTPEKLVSPYMVFASVNAALEEKTEAELIAQAREVLLGRELDEDALYIIAWWKMVDDFEKIERQISEEERQLQKDLAEIRNFIALRYAKSRTANDK